MSRAARTRSARVTRSFRREGILADGFLLSPIGGAPKTPPVREEFLGGGDDLAAGVPAGEAVAHHVLADTGLGRNGLLGDAGALEGALEACYPARLVVE